MSSHNLIYMGRWYDSIEQILRDVAAIARGVRENPLCISRYCTLHY